MTASEMQNDETRPPGAVPGAADWLRLAASPTFAIMALATSVLAGGPHERLCSAAEGASPLGGMALMYALMSAFHSAPWLKFLSGPGGRVRRLPR